MRVGAAVISVTVPPALGAEAPAAPMAFETQPFVSPNSATLADEVTVQAKLAVGTTFAWSMQDDHAVKHSVFFNTDEVGTTRTGAVSKVKQGKGEPAATREAFVLREMAAWGIYNNETNKLVVKLGD